MLKQVIMGISTSFAMLVAGCLFAFNTTLTVPAAAPGVRHYVKHFKQVGTKNCQGYLAFEAKFTGFAGRMNVYHTKLYIVQPAGQLAAAIKRQQIPFQYHEQIRAKAYQIPRFTLYMEGYAVIGQSGHKKTALKPSKVQVSDVLGDFTTPEFGPLNKEVYTGENGWEASGAIGDTEDAPLKITEIYFKDYDIRIK